MISRTCAAFGASGTPPVMMPSIDPETCEPNSTRVWSAPVARTFIPIARRSSTTVSSSRWPRRKTRRMRPGNCSRKAQRNESQSFRSHFSPSVEAPMCGRKHALWSARVASCAASMRAAMVVFGSGIFISAFLCYSKRRGTRANAFRPRPSPCQRVTSPRAASARPSVRPSEPQPQPAPAARSPRGSCAPAPRSGRRTRPRLRAPSASRRRSRRGAGRCR